jgi:hypothetical protein
VSVPARDHKAANSYVMHYPPHPARNDNPHYEAFEVIRRAWKAEPDRWQCAIGKHRGDFCECDLTKPLEVDHAHVEFSLQNGVDPA